MPVKLWEHQREALRRASEKKSFALFFEQGTGKTTTALHLFLQKCRESGRSLRALIFCPPIVISNWTREIDSNLSGVVPELTVKEVTGKADERSAALRSLDAGSCEGSAFAITNYEALLMRGVPEAIVAMAPDVLICDESQRLKDPASKRTKVLTELSEAITYKFLLSGTPCPNSLADVFSQFRILDGGATFGKDFFRFREEFFVNLNANRGRRISYPNWQAKQGAEELIQERMSPSAMRVTKSECLTLPPLVRQYVDVVLSGEQRRAYEQLQRNSVVRLGDGKVASADLAITKGLRLQQMASGFLQLDDGSTYHFTPNVRSGVLEDLIKSLPPSDKVIVWAVYRQDYEEIRQVLRRLGISYVELTGETPQAERSALADSFRTEKKVRALIGNPVAAGIGINLVEASYAIFYSRSFSLESDLQAEARNHRGGSERHEKVTRIDLVARGTIDEVVLHALKDKQNVQEAVLRHLNQEK